MENLEFSNEQRRVEHKHRKLHRAANNNYTASAVLIKINLRGKGCVFT